jgi:protein-L-isoaspartate(D-aspartate) O-methyltransferase
MSHYCMQGRTALSSVEVIGLAVKNISAIPKASLLVVKEGAVGAIAGITKPSYSRNVREPVMRLDAGYRMNALMVDRLIAQGSLWTRNLIASFRATPRHYFIDHIYVFNEDQGWREVVIRSRTSLNDLKLIYSDRALTTRLGTAKVGHSLTPISSSSQPSLMAQMLEDLHLQAGNRVLEIGAGTGYNAALMALVTGPGRVLSLDVDRQVLTEARKHLEAFSDREVVLLHADGRQVLPNHERWDRIIVTAATPDMEPAWIEQLKEGGTLVAPIDLATGLAFVVRGTVIRGTFVGRITRAAYFMPLRKEEESGDRLETGVSVPGDLRAKKAPWLRGTEPAKARNSYSTLVQSLAFYGWLKGLKAAYQTLPGGQVAYALQDQEASRTCWINTQAWFAEDELGMDLGQALWRSFLEAGAPRPTEFRLRISLNEILPSGESSESYVIHGPTCRQVWDLIEPRDRPMV